MTGLHAFSISFYSSPHLYTSVELLGSSHLFLRKTQGQISGTSFYNPQPSGSSWLVDNLLLVVSFKKKMFGQNWPLHTGQCNICDALIWFKVMKWCTHYNKNILQVSCLKTNSSLYNIFWVKSCCSALFWNTRIWNCPCDVMISLCSTMDVDNLHLYRSFQKIKLLEMQSKLIFLWHTWATERECFRWSLFTRKFNFFDARTRIIC